MSKRTILGRKVETDVPTRDDGSVVEPPGGFYSDDPPGGPQEAGQDTLARIAAALEGIGTELAELRKVLERSVGTAAPAAPAKPPADRTG